LWRRFTRIRSSCSAPISLKESLPNLLRPFHPHKVILFGSYAYGTPHKDSDVDLFVIMDSDESTHARIVKVTKVAKVPFLSMDIIVRTSKEVQERLAIGDFFVIEILEKGRVLYDRDATILLARP